MMRTAKFAILISIAIGCMSAQSVVSGSVTPKTCASGVSPDFYNTSLKILYKCVGGTYTNGVPTLVPPIYLLDTSVTAPIPSNIVNLTPTDTTVSMYETDSPHFADVGTDGFLQFLAMPPDSTVVFVHCTSIDCSTRDVTNMPSGDGDRFQWLSIGPDGKTRFMYEGSSAEIRFIECAVPNSNCFVHTDNTIAPPSTNTYEMSFTYSSKNTIIFGYTNYNTPPASIVIKNCADLQCNAWGITPGTIIADGTRVQYIQDIEINPITKLPTIAFVSRISNNGPVRFLNCSTNTCSSGTVTDLNLPVANYYDVMLKPGSDGLFRATSVAYDGVVLNAFFHRCLNATCSQNKTTVLHQNPALMFTTLGVAGNYATIAYTTAAESKGTWMQCADLDCTNGVTGTTILSGLVGISGALSGTNLLTVFAVGGANVQYVDFAPTGAYACLNAQGNLYRSLTPCN